MRLLLIRHGETVHNVAGIYAGITDSALTTHGVLQASRLGAHLVATKVNVSHIFSSDLQRALKTAEAIQLAQPNPLKMVTQLHLLREQDFGFYEGKHFYERPKGSDKSGKEAHRDAHLNTEWFQDVESKQSMRTRVEAFLDGHLLSLFAQVADGETVAVVAHGIILSYLWKGILARFDPENVFVAAGVVLDGNGMGLGYLGSWSNTGYLDLEIQSQFLPSSAHAASLGHANPFQQIQNIASEMGALRLAKPGPTLGPLPGPPSALLMQQINSAASSLVAQQAPVPVLPNGSALSFPTNPVMPGSSTQTSVPVAPRMPLNLSLLVKAVNSQEHLKGLKKTRGGIGSAKHDEKQKTMNSFFKRRKLG